MNANVWDVTEPIQQLIRDRVAIDPEQLADPDTPLDMLTGTPQQPEPIPRATGTRTGSRT